MRWPRIIRRCCSSWARNGLTPVRSSIVRVHPARSPILAVYGEEFSQFLASFPPAAELPYLSEVARVDRLWVEAHTARDAPVLASSALAQSSPETLATLKPPLHPATRFAWVRHSAATIWMHHRSASTETGLEIQDAEEGILLTRPAGAVEYQPLDRAAFVFLKSLGDGEGLAAAAAAALTHDPSADVAGLLAKTVVAGAFECPQELLR